MLFIKKEYDSRTIWENMKNCDFVVIEIEDTQSIFQINENSCTLADYSICYVNVFP